MTFLKGIGGVAVGTSEITPCESHNGADKSGMGGLSLNGRIYLADLHFITFQNVLLI